jgi:hypothetical protein
MGLEVCLKGKMQQSNEFSTQLGGTLRRDFVAAYSRMRFARLAQSCPANSVELLLFADGQFKDRSDSARNH